MKIQKQRYIKITHEKIIKIKFTRNKGDNTKIMVLDYKAMVTSLKFPARCFGHNCGGNIGNVSNVLP